LHPIPHPISNLHVACVGHPEREEQRAEARGLRRRVEGAVADCDPLQVDTPAGGRSGVTRVDGVGDGRDVLARVRLARRVEGVAAQLREEVEELLQSCVQVLTYRVLVARHAPRVGRARVACAKRVVKSEEVRVEVPVHGARLDPQIVRDAERSKLGVEADQR